MSSTLGSADSLSRSAGGLSAGLQERNRYWILFLEARIGEVEGKMRASGDLERSREPAIVSTANHPTNGSGETAVATAAGGWNWRGPGNGASAAVEEGE